MNRDYATDCRTGLAGAEISRLESSTKCNRLLDGGKGSVGEKRDHRQELCVYPSVWRGRGYATQKWQPLHPKVWRFRDDKSGGSEEREVRSQHTSTPRSTTKHNTLEFFIAELFGPNETTIGWMSVSPSHNQLQHKHVIKRPLNSPARLELHEELASLKVDALETGTSRRLGVER